jgi:hypothetical protein
VRISSIGYTTVDLSAQIPASYSPVTHRRVEIDKDGARDEFAIAKLGENCLIGVVSVDVRNDIRIYMAIGC